MIVPILLGSEVDKPHAAKITAVLDEFGISHEVIVVSAHKVPEKLISIIEKYNQEQDVCYVTIAGRSNGLSGCTAGSSIHPVVACPPFKDKGDFMVNINSTLQMPSDTPVLTVIDPKNCGLCVARILGIKDATIQKKVADRVSAVKAKF